MAVFVSEFFEHNKARRAIAAVDYPDFRRGDRLRVDSPVLEFSNFPANREISSSERW